MTIHVCKKCEKQFSRKENLARHLNKKQSCVIEEEGQRPCSCQYCNKQFSFDSNLSRHRKTCSQLADARPAQHYDNIRQQIAELQAQPEGCNRQGQFFSQKAKHDALTEYLELAEDMALGFRVYGFRVYKPKP